MRAVRSTAGPITVKSSRVSLPILPYITSPCLRASVISQRMTGWFSSLAMEFITIRA
jgi:hypothetical protein